MQKIYLASDHGGYELKEHLKGFLADKFKVEDLGCDSSASVDYPSFGHIAAEKAIADCTKAIVICGTGIGISIAANKVQGARCALCTNSTMARLAREHNDANILALGGRLTGALLAEDIAHTFLTTEFSGEKRHSCRIAQIEE